jgi:6-phosphofructokinase 1
MNTAVAAATKVALSAGCRVVGVRNGYDGLVDGDLMELDADVVRDWWRRGGTELGSARAERFRTPEGRAQAAYVLRRLPDLAGLLVIGGNGSLTGAQIFGEESGVPVMGLPASIDNDLACTSLAIGVDTALNTIVEACDRLGDTARSHRRVFLVEVMGRESGFLAMGAGIAVAADAVLVPERSQGRQQLLDEVGALVTRAFTRDNPRSYMLILKAEGVPVPTPDLVADLKRRLDAAAPGVSVRSAVLGHIVRGGPPSRLDRLVASRLAHVAVRELLAGVGGEMVGWDPREPNGTATVDPRVQRYPLARVLTETGRLLSGSHPSTRARLRLLDAVAGVLAL